MVDLPARLADGTAGVQRSTSCGSRAGLKCAGTAPAVLVVDDGSTDDTAARLAARADIEVVTHERNRGYGAALITAFQYAVDHQYDVLVTIDCDGQHEPQRIPRFAAACRDVDIVSGSRYLRKYAGDSAPPVQRQQINQRLYRRTEPAAGPPPDRCVLRLQSLSGGGPRATAPRRRPATRCRWNCGCKRSPWGCGSWNCRFRLVYLEEERSFGGMLDDADTRLRYYYEVLERSIRAAGLQVPAAVDRLGGGSVG